MPSQAAVPPLIAPQINASSQSSLCLVSSVLSASSNWLILRFICATLNPAATGLSTTLAADGAVGWKRRRVIFVSFLRGFEFWKGEAKRLGLDLSRLADKKQFAYIDGLSSLFTGPAIAAAPPSVTLRNAPRTIALPARSQPGPVPVRSPVPAPMPTNNIQPAQRSEVYSGLRLNFTGRGIAALDVLEKDIVSVINQLKQMGQNDDEPSECLLILDQPDLLLAATGPEMGISATTMNEWIMGLQQTAGSLVISVSADSPLIHNATASVSKQATPLETEHAAFVIESAHRAQAVLQLRNLETGAAKDVSGVLRISKGGAWEANKGTFTESKYEEMEVLYFVHRDGSVRVFGRGES